MANSHNNTEHMRVPLRTAERVRRFAKDRGLTMATTLDEIVAEYMERHAPEIIEATADLPEPRRALPPRERVEA